MHNLHFRFQLLEEVVTPFVDVHHLEYQVIAADVIDASEGVPEGIECF